MKSLLSSSRLAIHSYLSKQSILLPFTTGKLGFGILLTNKMIIIISTNIPAVGVKYLLLRQISKSSIAYHLQLIMSFFKNLFLFAVDCTVYYWQHIQGECWFELNSKVPCNNQQICYDIIPA